MKIFDIKLTSETSLDEAVESVYKLLVKHYPTKLFIVQRTSDAIVNVGKDIKIIKITPTFFQINVTDDFEEQFTDIIYDVRHSKILNISGEYFEEV
jgi:hypothetical protein